MEINRKWEMPNSKTFRIKCIKELIQKYCRGVVIDPFANDGLIRHYIKCDKYISNDLDPQYKCDYNLEAQEFLKIFSKNSIDVALIDPPYSPRQVSECYKSFGRTVTMQDTNMSYFLDVKRELQRIMKEDGIVITFGWNTNGIGKKYGFEIVEILIVAHGSMHNDTLVTVERKIKNNKCSYVNLCE